MADQQTRYPGHSLIVAPAPDWLDVPESARDHVRARLRSIAEMHEAGARDELDAGKPAQAALDGARGAAFRSVLRVLEEKEEGS